MHPLALLGIWLGVGCLFSLQEYVELRGTGMQIKLATSMICWAAYSLICGSGFVSVWLLLRNKIQTASWRFLLAYLVPLSLVASLLEEMLYVACLPMLVTAYVHRSYWMRLERVMSGEFVSNMAFFWVGIFIARGVGYYESYKQKEVAASRLETELIGAQLRALRMQLNPHFLFNTMNGVSSLMRADVDAADAMLEQLSRLLRMTLDRGDLQEVSLREEIEFVQLYLEIQRSRFGERLRYEIDVPAGTLDARIPTMILQPVVENAYRHGISVSSGPGLIRITAMTTGQTLIVKVLNTGLGLNAQVTDQKNRSGIGVANVKSRLQLHFQTNQSFVLEEIEPGLTEARLTMPWRTLQAIESHSGEGLSA